MKTPRVVFDGYCYDWDTDIDPEKRDPLVGHGPEHPLGPYGEWEEILITMDLGPQVYKCIEQGIIKDG